MRGKTASVTVAARAARVQAVRHWEQFQRCSQSAAHPACPKARENWCAVHNVCPCARHMPLLNMLP